MKRQIHLPFSRYFYFSQLLAILVLFANISYAIEPTATQITQFKSLPQSQQSLLISKYKNKNSTVNKPNKLSNPETQKNKNNDDDDKSAYKRRNASNSLKLFGYSLFSKAPTTFAPATDIPVPFDYRLGPGDTVKIQLSGKEFISQKLLVDREGFIHIKQMKPISVIGLSFDKLNDFLTKKINSQMIGMNLEHISMGALRSVKIFVLGEAFRPGSYTISSLSTMTNALFASGGIKKIGSLRKIQLKRQGKIITTFDLYDLLLNGDTSKDQRIQNGDVIFIPPIGETIGIAGNVRRPAIYETITKKTIQQAIKLAGGLLVTTYKKRVKLERISKTQENTIIDLDLSNDKHLKTIMQDGDILNISPILDLKTEIITLSGHVGRPGDFQWYKGQRLTDVVPPIHKLPFQTDLNYSLIIRINEKGILTALSVNLQKALSNNKSRYNILLKPSDRILVFGLGKDRTTEIRAITESLKQQSKYNQLSPVVSISGHVQYSGSYPLTPKMKLSNLINAAAGVLPSRYDLSYVLISRTNAKTGKLEVITTQLNNAKSSSDILLKPEDKVRIFSSQDNRSESIKGIVALLKQQRNFNQLANVVSISGHVEFPGTYPLTQKMKITDLINAASGVLPTQYDLSYVLIARTIVETGKTMILTTNLSKINNFPEYNIFLKPEDEIRLFSLNENRANAVKPYLSRLFLQRTALELAPIVKISGNVEFPGQYPLTNNMTITDLINAAAGVLPTRYDLSYVLVTRTNPETGMINVRTTYLDKILASKDTDNNNLLLQPGDQVRIFGANEDRAQILTPVINQLRSQSYQRKDELVVNIQGHVKWPGNYPFSHGMMLSDLIKASADILPNTDLDYLLIVRTEKSGVLRPFSFQLRNFYNQAGTKKDIKLQPRDTIIVFQGANLGLEGYSENNDVTLGSTIQNTINKSSKKQLLGTLPVPIRNENLPNTNKNQPVNGLSQNEQMALLAGNKNNLDQQTLQQFYKAQNGKLSNQSDKIKSIALNPQGKNFLSKQDETLPDTILKTNTEEDNINIPKSKRTTSARHLLLQPVISALRSQANNTLPSNIVSITGNVRFPGEFPLEENMKISTLIRAAGFLTESAYRLKAEISHLEVINHESRVTRHEIINLKKLLEGDLSHDLTLKPYDNIHIQPIPNWSEHSYVKILGEVKFPGEYIIKKGETLTDLVVRVGGLTEYSFPEGAIFLRKSLKIRQQKEIKKLNHRLQIEILNLQSSDEKQISTEEKALKIDLLQKVSSELQLSQAQGRLAIDLKNLINFNNSDQIILKDGDTLVIPGKSSEITVLGEVYYPSSHHYKTNKTFEDYINLSGGYSKLANSNDVYVVKANGQIISSETLKPYGSSWFGINRFQINPGDTIVVPIEIQQTSTLRIIKQVSTILFNLATTAATLHTVGGI